MSRFLLPHVGALTEITGVILEMLLHLLASNGLLVNTLSGCGVLIIIDKIPVKAISI